MQDINWCGSRMALDSFSKLKVNSIIALPIVGFAGAMVNTITVMGSIYILLQNSMQKQKMWQSVPYGDW